VLALACVSEAAEGGDSMLVSAAALRDAVRRRAPEALAPLERGYPHGINEKVGGVRPVTEAPVPIFSTTGGRLACCYNRYFIHSAARLRGEDLPADLAEAMAILDEEAVRPGLGLRFGLRPGEMLFWHNWTCLHARTAFRDSASRRRLLLRLWLNLSDGRAVDPRVAARAAQIDADHRLALARRRAA
jgi:alpha-ketoglutarate-dependent taurine dioxygenase